MFSRIFSPNVLLFSPHDFFKYKKEMNVGAWWHLLSGTTFEHRSPIPRLLLVPNLSVTMRDLLPWSKESLNNVTQIKSTTHVA